ncbi:MAG TPA: hypothetical protein VIY52_21285 [Streptosporangiaceae bacterium]
MPNVTVVTRVYTSDAALTRRRTCCDDHLSLSCWRSPPAPCWPLSISATDPAHAWALIACPGPKPSCGRGLLATADGGRRWRVTATLPQAVNLVRFASGRLGVAISDRCLVDLSPTRCPGQVLVSRDGGVHWTPVLSGPAPIFATASAAGQLWAAQTYPSAFGPTGPGASAIRFLTSTDGGRPGERDHGAGRPGRGRRGGDPAFG